MIRYADRAGRQQAEDQRASRRDRRPGCPSGLGISVALSGGDRQGDGGFHVGRVVADHGPEDPHAPSVQGNDRSLM